MRKFPIKPNTTCQYQHTFSSNKKRGNKKGNSCYCLNYLEKKGNIQLILKDGNPNIFISKLTLVDFDDNFDNLLEKGKVVDARSIKDENFASSIDKNYFGYYEQRYYFYEKYDLGIKMDKESWWSVTPEIIAEYIAKLAKGSTVIEAFAGSGGNVIQFSKHCKKVYAIDISQKKLDICRNNCKVYKCPENISYILSDFLLIDKYEKEKVEGDYVFLSPPWGGTEYKYYDIYQIKEWMKPSIYDIIKMCIKTSKKIMFYLPRNLLLNELFGIINEITKNEKIFFDVHILKSAHKIKALLIIFGEDIDEILTEDDIKNYLINEYKNYPISENDINIFLQLRKLLGTFNFFKVEYRLRNELIKDDSFIEDEKITRCLPNEVIKKIFTNVLTEQEKIKLKSLNILPKKHKLDFHQKEKTKHKPIHINTEIKENINSTPSEYSNCSTLASNSSLSNLKAGWELKEVKAISFEILI